MSQMSPQRVPKDSNFSGKSIKQNPFFSVSISIAETGILYRTENICINVLYSVICIFLVGI